MSLGFIQAGYDVVVAFDNWSAAIEIHEVNRDLLQHSIVTLDLSEVPDDISIFRKYKADMIIGGPPCQDFSSAGKRDETLGRADLTVIFARITAKVKPKWFVMENVDRTVKSNAYAIAYEVFHEAGYGLTQSILDASLCGAPQRRKRLFLIGELDGNDGALLYYLEKNKASKAMTLRDYFGDSLGVEYYYRHPRSYQRRGIFSIDEPSPTIRGVNRPVPKTYRRHPGDRGEVTPELRPLTTRERALIQTFPKEYKLVGSKTDIEQMLGNGVPVKLAEYVARCIQEYIEQGETKAAKQSSGQVRMW